MCVLVYNIVLAIMYSRMVNLLSLQGAAQLV